MFPLAHLQLPTRSLVLFLFDTRKTWGAWQPTILVELWSCQQTDWIGFTALICHEFFLLHLDKQDFLPSRPLSSLPTTLLLLSSSGNTPW